MEQQWRMEDDGEIEIDLVELFFVLLGHWIPICAVTLALGAAAYIYSAFYIVPQYASTSRLYVLSKSTSITSITDIQVGASLTTDYVEVVGGRPVLDKVIENLGMEIDYPTLLAKVAVTNPTNTRLLDITVTDADPAVAKVIADEIAEVSSNYIAQKMDQDAPTVIQRGYTDEGPVSPNIFKNTAIGAFAGMFLSAGAVVFFYFINDTVRGPEEAEQRAGLRVLGTLPDEEWNKKDKATPKKKSA